MKKILGCIFDVLLISVAFGATDIIMAKLGSDEWWLDLLIFIGISLVLEGFKWLITRPFKK